MTLFVISVGIVLVASAICSLSEAAIYAVRKPYIMNLVESGSPAGRVLAGFKENMALPISAILIVNTAANTAGAAVAGYQVQEIFGRGAIVWFTLLFTLAVLVFSEIIPKVIGVLYNRGVAKMVAVPWAAAIKVLYPLVWIIERLTQVFEPKEPVITAPEEEVKQLAAISAKEGSILPIEAELVKNVLKLNDVSASDILTPRSVVFRLSSEMTIRQVAADVREWTVSRIPIFDKNDPENWTGMVMTRQILTCMAKDQFDTTLSSLAKPMFFVPEQSRAHVLLREFLRRRTHLFGVLDEYGEIEGVVSLEDVIESLIGEEIIDEVDTAVDMQAVARIRSQQDFGKEETNSEKNETDEKPDHQ